MIQNFEMKRLKARPLIKNDSHHFLNRFDEVLCQYMPEIPIGTDALFWVDDKLSFSQSYLCHVIEDINSNRVVGFVQLAESDACKLRDKLAIELGYFFLPEFWGKGYATELVSSIINGFVDNNNWDQEVIGWVYDGNIQSVKLLEKNGFFKAQSKIGFSGDSKTMYVYQSHNLKGLLKNV